MSIPGPAAASEDPVEVTQEVPLGGDDDSVRAISWALRHRQGVRCGGGEGAWSSAWWSSCLPRRATSVLVELGVVPATGLVVTTSTVPVTTGTIQQTVAAAGRSSRPPRPI